MNVHPVIDRLHGEIKRLDIRQAEISSALHLTQSAVSRKLRGETPMTVDELWTICWHFGIEPVDLFPPRSALSRAS